MKQVFDFQQADKMFKAKSKAEKLEENKLKDKQ
jgi:hypothetical protein